ncbi:hypothetical protein QA310_03455 [Glaesserella parasuis]|uniref:hypothetical protein n=1 Tax=Glaesserella parasuis TaxID=738 RepID=UPI002436A0C5|nr:hypothetical protein [Glaesserella parasuis]MDG6831999.1 hypothetical protein [Glaesserella parasuis]
MIFFSGVSGHFGGEICKMSANGSAVNVGLWGYMLFCFLGDGVRLYYCFIL